MFVGMLVLISVANVALAYVRTASCALQRTPTALGVLTATW